MVRRTLLPALTGLALTCAAASPSRAWDLGDHDWDFDDHRSFPWLDRLWSSAGNGPSDAHHAVGEHVLSPGTVGNLVTRWVFAARGEVPDTPTVEKANVYLSDLGGSVWRIDAKTGHAVWETKLPSVTGNPYSNSRVSPAIGRYAVVVGDQAGGTVVALSKADGHLLWKTTVSSDAGAIVTSSPIVVGNRVYVGTSSQQEFLATTPGFVLTFRGSVAALDASDGHVVWQTYTVPTGFTGGAVWSSNLAVDPFRHAVYLSSGNNYSVPVEVSACQQAATTPDALSACLPPDDHIDSVVSLNSDTGAVNWGRRFTAADTSTLSCRLPVQPGGIPCPTPSGPDADFGAAPNLFSIHDGDHWRDVVGAGQKSGIYWTVDRDTGDMVWATRVGPGGYLGGILWGTATDGKRVYVPVANSEFVPTKLTSGFTTSGGYFSALDVATGKVVWSAPTLQNPSPAPGSKPALVVGSLSVANGVMYGEDTAGFFVALDARTGRLLFNLDSGGAAIAAPAVVQGVLYWGSGDSRYGTANNKLYALWLGYN